MKQEYRELETYLRELRREFHRYPELCWTEFRTSARVIEELEKLGLTVRYGRQIHADQEMRDCRKRRCSRPACAAQNRRAQERIWWMPWRADSPAA